MKKLFFSIYLKTKNLVLSIKQFNKFHIMDKVIYDGKVCFINNGTSYPMWDICEEEPKKDGTRNCYCVHETKLKKIICKSNIKNDLFYHYIWWKKYWYEIDLRKMLSN